MGFFGIGANKVFIPIGKHDAAKAAFTNQCQFGILVQYCPPCTCLLCEYLSAQYGLWLATRLNRRLATLLVKPVGEGWGKGVDEFRKCMGMTAEQSKTPKNSEDPKRSAAKVHRNANRKGSKKIVSRQKIENLNKSEANYDYSQFVEHFGQIQWELSKVNNQLQVGQQRQPIKRDKENISNDFEVQESISQLSEKQAHFDGQNKIFETISNIKIRSELSEPQTQTHSTDSKAAKKVSQRFPILRHFPTEIFSEVKPKSVEIVPISDSMLTDIAKRLAKMVQVNPKRYEQSEISEESVRKLLEGRRIEECNLTYMKYYLDRAHSEGVRSKDSACLVDTGLGYSPRMRLQTTKAIIDPYLWRRDGCWVEVKGNNSESRRSVKDVVKLIDLTISELSRQYATLCSKYGKMDALQALDELLAYEQLHSLAEWFEQQGAKLYARLGDGNDDDCSTQQSKSDFESAESPQQPSKAIKDQKPSERQRLTDRILILLIRLIVATWRDVSVLVGRFDGGAHVIDYDLKGVHCIQTDKVNDIVAQFLACRLAI